MLACESPSFSVTLDSGPFTSLVRWLYWMTPLPVLNVMNRRGSLMKFTPVLKSWPRPPRPAICHEKSSRNWYFCCSVVCGELMFCPVVTPLGNDSYGVWLRAEMWLAKSAYWNTNSFRRDPASDALWFTLIELNRFALSPQSSGVASGAAPYGCELLLRPYRIVRYCVAE